MKKLTIFFTAIIFQLTAYSQQLARVALSSNGNSETISFLTDDNVIITINKEGSILNWGIENKRIPDEYSQGRLDKYMGREEYYGNEADPAYKGKVKYIGITGIKYYTESENEFFKGKIKSIGSLYFDYYNKFDDELLAGKIKSAGRFSFTHYGSFEDAAFKGKLSGAGNVSITYYAAREDKAFSGKLKSIGSYTYTYYSSFDQKEYRGMMRTGSRFINVNGIKFYLNY